MTRPERYLAWLEEGGARLREAVAELPEAEFARPSLLPEWSRATLIAHLANNGTALSNLATWARTGVETPMYASAEQRAADIVRLAAEPVTRIRMEFLGSDAQLGRDLADLPDEAWSATVRTARGRPVPASEIPWMRDREVWVHAIDLDTGLRFADIPVDVLTALVDDAAGMMSRAGEPVLARATDHDREWRFGTGDGEPATVAAPVADLAAWALGRPNAAGATVDPDWPALPAWL